MANQFSPFSYAGVVGAAENIRGARTRNALAQQQLDPQSTQNLLRQEQLTGARQGNVLAQQAGTRAQTTFDQGQQQKNTEYLYQALTEISQNPRAAGFHVPKLQEMGILRSDFDYQTMSPEEIQTKAAEGAASIGKSLGKGAPGKGPSAVQEYNFYQDLTPANKSVFLQIKRAQPNAKFVDTGDTVQVFDPVTAQPIAEIDKGLPPAQQPKAIEEAATVKADVALATKEKAMQAHNKKAFDTYVVGMDRLTKAMSGTVTGPVAGRMPAVTAGQQIAEGSLASMAPILKQLFRASGEGIFTDKDQELLMNMLPTRTDQPEAVQSKIDNINAIVASKLGMGESTTESGGWTVEEL